LAEGAGAALLPSHDSCDVHLVLVMTWQKARGRHNNAAVLLHA
jgi:hypothetical protein